VPSKTFNAPAEVLSVAEHLVRPRFNRRAVLTAAVRAACGCPPPAPVSYPTLTTATRKVSLPLTDDLHAALRAAEAAHFYGRTAWLVFYALVHYSVRIEELLRLDAEALAEQDRAVLQRQSEVRACIPLTTRVPRVPKASPKK
jgi:hypothetical protein